MMKIEGVSRILYDEYQNYWFKLLVVVLNYIDN